MYFEKDTQIIATSAYKYMQNTLLMMSELDINYIKLKYTHITVCYKSNYVIFVKIFCISQCWKIILEQKCLALRLFFLWSNM